MIYLIIIVVPAIEAVKHDYVSTIGSNVTLTCHITNLGRPVARFGWRRNGLWLSNDSFFSNSTHLSLPLFNITNDDAGRYDCAAEGGLSFDVQNINLYLKGIYV